MLKKMSFSLNNNDNSKNTSKPYSPFHRSINVSLSNAANIGVGCNPIQGEDSLLMSEKRAFKKSFIAKLPPTEERLKRHSAIIDHKSNNNSIINLKIDRRLSAGRQSADKFST